MKKLLGLLLLAATHAFANPFLVCPTVTGGVSNSPATYTVSGLPNSPITANAVTITSGTVQLDLDLGPSGQNVPPGSYTVSATATNPNGTSAASSNFALTINPAYVQNASFFGTSTAVNSVAKAYASAQASGNTNVVWVEWNAASTPPTISSITDTNGNTYTLAKALANYTGGGGHNNGSVYYATGIAAGSNTVTVNFSATTATFASILVTEYNGLGAFDAASGTDSTTGTSPSSGSLTTTVASDQLIGLCGCWSAITAPGSGYTQRALLNSSDWIFEDQVAGAAGSYSAGCTQTSSTGWIAFCLAFKP